MSDTAYYLLVACVAFVGLAASIAGRRHRRNGPRPTRQERWLGAQSSIGAALLVISTVIGGVPLMFAIMYLHARDAGPNNHRDSLAVIVVVSSLFVVGLALYLTAQRRLRRLRQRRSPSGPQP